jgi:AsmA-like C-terminal region
MSAMLKMTKRKAWLTLLFVLVCIAISAQMLTSYLSSTWDKTKVESTLSAALSRQVRLGNIDWHIGFRGLEFETSEISILSSDKTPFFRSGKTIVLFGIFPLLRGQLRVKHLDMQKPEAWLIRLTPNQWNFSDLKQTPIFSKFADCKITDGTLEILDKRSNSNVHFPATEIKHIQFSVSRPFGKIYWPFKASAEIAQPEGLCTLAITGSGKGTLNDWQNCHYTFDLTAHNLAPLRVVDFCDSMPETDGLVDLEIKGEGTPSSDFKGTTQLKTDHIAIKVLGQAPLKISNTSTRGEVSFNKKELAWKGFSLKVGESELKSEGKVNLSLPDSSRYEATVDSRMEALGHFLKNVDAQWLTSGLNNLPKDLALYGKLGLSGSIANTPGQHSSISSIILHDAQIKLKGNNLDVSALNGTIQADQDGLHLKQIKGKLKNGTFEASGDLSPQQNNTLKLKAYAMAIEDMKVLASSLHVPSMLDSLAISGNLKTLDLLITGTSKHPKVNFTATPDNVVIADINHVPILKLNSGVLACNDVDLTVDKLTGTVGNGTFSVNGKIGLAPDAPCNVTVNGQHFDLAEISRAYHSLRHEDKSKANDVVIGKVTDLNLRITGTQQKPRIDLTLSPEDIIYQADSPRSVIHMMGGIVAYNGDVLKLENSNIKGSTTSCVASAKVFHCQSNPHLGSISLNNALLDFKEISNLLSATTTPQPIRELFASLLNQYQISDLRGKLSGSLAAEHMKSNPKFSANCSLHAVRFKRSGQTVLIDSGSFITNRNNSVELQGINCSVNKSILSIDGRLNDFNGFQTLHPDLKLQGKLYSEDIGSILQTPAVFVTSSQPILISASVKDSPEAIKTMFSASLAPDAKNSIIIDGITYSPPANQPLSANGVISMHESKTIIGTTQIKVGPLTFQTAGTITHLPDNPASIDLKAWIHDPIPLFGALAFINPGMSDDDPKSVSGTIRGGIHLTGPIDNPTISGGCHLLGAGLPKRDLTNISGHLQIALTPDDKNPRGRDSIIKVNLDTVNLGTVLLKNITGSLLLAQQQTQTKITTDGLKGVVTGGSFNTTGGVTLNDPFPVQAHLQLSNLDANLFVKALGGKDNEVTGKAGVDLDITCNAKSKETLLSSLSGAGSFSMTNGRIDKLSQLQEKLEQASMLAAGILGFRLSNILFASDSKENGKFLSTKSQFEIENGLVQLKNIDFEGEEMQLKATGSLGLTSKQLSLHATGDLSRILNEGTVGKVTSMVGLAGLTNFVEKETHLKTGSIPVIGGASNSANYPFAFDAEGNLDKPKDLEHSIATTFHWTRNTPPSQPIAPDSKSPPTATGSPK